LSGCHPRKSDDQGWSSVTEAKDGERGPVLGPLIKEHFRRVCYDDRKGVGSCDRGPSALGRREALSGSVGFFWTRIENFNVKGTKG
jgi:hypothetical protein